MASAGGDDGRPKQLQQCPPRPAPRSRHHVAIQSVISVVNLGTFVSLVLCRWPFQSQLDADKRLLMLNERLCKPPGVIGITRLLSL